MDTFKAALELELKRSEKQVENGNRILDSSPEGFLTVRPRKDTETYYWNVGKGQSKSCEKKRKQINLNDNPKLVYQLAEKKYQREMVLRAEQNLNALQRLNKAYCSTDPSEIIETLGPQYKKVFVDRKQQLIEKRMTARYSKFPYNPKYHKHETDYGELVRSKSEQILANALFAHGIPFHYEEEFLYRIGNIGHVYPDFTIFFPDGRRKIWEHLGMLDDIAYCTRFAEKLNLYQMNGFTIGKNLIITMDDANGNLSSGIIQQMIRDYILPELGDLRADPDIIIAGMQRSK